MGTAVEGRRGGPGADSGHTWGLADREGVVIWSCGPPLARSLLEAWHWGQRARRPEEEVTKGKVCTERLLSSAPPTAAG